MITPCLSDAGKDPLLMASLYTANRNLDTSFIKNLYNSDVKPIISWGFVVLRAFIQNSISFRERF